MTKAKKRVMAVAAAAAAVAVAGSSFALWMTTLTGGGDVSAYGSWNVALTDADITVSTGAAVQSEPDYTLVRAQNSITDYRIVEYTGLDASARTDNWDLIGTQIPDGAGASLSSSSHIYLIDTTKYSLDEIKGTAVKAEIAEDETSIPVSDYLNKYYYNYTKDTSSQKKQEAAGKVVNGLIGDSLALIKQLRPDDYQNYALVHIRAKTSTTERTNYVIASMEQTAGSGADAVIDGTDVDFADVSFSLPGAWAQYSITVENSGTVNANLTDAVIRLDTQDASQLSLDAPELDGLVLEPGGSRTITFVVEALDDGSGTLDAAGTIVVELPFEQDTVEPAPEASVTE